MADRLIQTGTLTDIADAIRAKTGKSATMTPLEMPSEIESIETGGGLPTGMTNVGYGSFTFASRTILNTAINHGLSFTPRAIIIWTNAELSADMFYCLLTRQLANNTGTTKSERFFASKASDTTGLEITHYSSTNADFFITSTTFNVGHGARWYAAGATYNWFAFA